MKCKMCNNEIKETMKYCPFCSTDLTKQISIKKRKNIYAICLVVLITISIIAINEFLSTRETKNEIKERLPEIVKSICNNNYEIVYENKNLPYQGIYECKNNNYVYFIKHSEEKGENAQNKRAEMYEIGYVYHEDIEKVFPGEAYFYRESRISTLSNELKIALVAENEDDLLDKYSEKLYQLIKNLNSEFKNDLLLIVYYNSNLVGIKTTYEKLFLMASFYSNNVSQYYGLQRGYGEYVFSDADPTEILSSIFVSPSNYLTSARDALKKNRHIKVEIVDGKTITLDDFLYKLSYSFESPL